MGAAELYLKWDIIFWMKQMEHKERVVLKIPNFIDNLNYFMILFLIIGYILFSKKFSKLNINFLGIPFYVTETIVILIIALYLYKIIFVNSGKLIIKNPLKIEFFLFYFVFFISLISGFFLYSDCIYILRQSALYYYSIFYFLIILIFSNIRNFSKVRFIFILFFIFSNIVAFLFIFNVLGIIDIGNTGFLDASYFYISILLLIELVYLTYLRQKVFIAIFLTNIFILSVVIILYNVSGNWVALLIAIMLFCIFFIVIPKIKTNLKRFGAIIFITTLCMLVLISIIFVYKPFLLFGTKEEVLSFFNILTGKSSAAINARWRLITWRDMIFEVFKRPMLGYGFGKKFISQTTLNLGWTTGLKEGWVEAHNFCLSFLYRSGFLGLSVFFLVIGSFLNKVMRFLKICKEEEIKIIIVSLLLCIIYILALGLFEVVLEVPYHSFFLWIFMGLVVVIMNFYNEKFVVC